MAATMLFRPTSREITTKFSSRRRRFGRSKRASHIILAASTSSRTHLDPREPPKVVIVGGGPGGLLAGIMLSNLGIRSTVLERSRERDGWSSAKSYTIVLNERGQDALKKAGCLEEALEAGMRRQYVYLVDGDTGEMKAVPKNPAGLGFTRPLLMDCLESIAGGLPNVTVKRGVGVSSVEKCATGSGLELRLEDDESLLTATHVIGCDGKWSKVRQSVASFRKQARLVTCPSFAVHMTSNFTPAGWERDGTYVIRPSEQQQQQHYYIIASPLPEKGMSMTMVCQSEMAEKYPWLEPPTSKKPRDVLSTRDYDQDSWENDFHAEMAFTSPSLGGGSDSSRHVALPDQLEALFRRDLPAFYEAAVDRETLTSARIGRRVTWLQGLENYSAEDGTLALLGDSAHAMTASMGEGCNTALESATKLVEALKSTASSSSSSCCTTTTTSTLSEAFKKYGASRPKDVVPIQEMSAARNGWKKS